MKSKAKKQKTCLLIAIFAISLAACSGGSRTADPLLEGQTWILRSYNNRAPLDGRQPTLVFEADQVSGNTGCNHYGGSYQIEGDTLRFGGLFQTEMACLEPEGLMDQEQAYLALLGAVERFERTDRMLTLFTQTNQTLVFDGQPDQTAE